MSTRTNNVAVTTEPPPIDKIKVAILDILASPAEQTTLQAALHAFQEAVKASATGERGPF